MQVSAVRLRPSYILRPTAFLFPDTIAFERGRVTITRRRLFGLLKSQDDIGVAQVASVELHSGILNATVTVQTSVRRDVDLSVSNLPKKKAGELVAEIRSGAR